MKTGRPPNKTPSASVHVTIPEPLADDINKYAKRKDWSMSKACAKLIQKGWKKIK